VQLFNTAEVAALHNNKGVGKECSGQLASPACEGLGGDSAQPVGGLMGGAQLLRKTPLPERAQTIVGMMEGSAARMAALID
jgi:nitrogen-specific signal transduction histidine kinase